MSERRPVGFNRPLAVAGLLALVAGCLVLVLRPDPLGDVDAWLDDQALVINEGLDGPWRPGAVLRLDDPAAPAPPAVTDCFAAELTRPSPLSAPVRFGRPGNVLVLPAAQARRFLPSLPAGEWALEIANARRKRVLRTPTPSDACARVLAGEPDVFGVVVEAAYAERLAFTAPSPAVLAALRPAVAAALPGAAVEMVEGGGETAPRLVATPAEPVVLAYRFVPWSVVKGG